MINAVREGEDFPKPKTVEDLEKISESDGHNLSFGNETFKLPSQIRKFEDTDYEPLKNIMNNYLSKYYDGHSDKTPLLDQLINKENNDSQGFFTKNKFVFVYQNEEGAPVGLIAVNNKRGPSVKTGPLLVHENYQGKGIGRTLKLVAEKVCRDLGAHKMYATTSYSNDAAVSLNEALGYKKEVFYIDQYKKGSNEIILGKILNPENELSPEVKRKLQGIFQSVYNELPIQGDYEIRNATENDLEYIESVRKSYQQRHDDLNEDFTEGMLRAQERGMDFQTKGKSVLVLNDDQGAKGMGTLTPKRGGPCKVYPIAGSKEAQSEIIKKCEEICNKIGGTKMYTFAQEYDESQLIFLKSQGFTVAKNEEKGIHGIIQSPYKVGYNLVALEKIF